MVWVCDCGNQQLQLSIEYRTLTCGHEKIAVRGEAAAEQLGAVPCDFSLAVGKDLAVDRALVRMGKAAAAAAKVSGLQVSC